MRNSICKFLGSKAGMWLVDQLSGAAGRKLSFTNEVHWVEGQLVWEICANGRCFTMPITAEQAEEIINKVETRLYMGNNVVMKIKNVEFNQGLSFVGQLSW